MNEQEEKTVEQVAEEIAEIVLEHVPAEKQEELAEKVQEISGQNPVEDVQPEKGLEAIKWLFRHAIPKPQTGTPAHSNKKRGVGITRKDKSGTKKSQKTAKNSRRKNRGK